MKRRYVIGIVCAALLCVVLLVMFITPSVRVTYHQWRMNVAYNTLFGDPEPVGNGLASHDLTGVDVDAVTGNYEFHRTKLVELNVLAHLRIDFPNLATDGSEQRSAARSAFVDRMWDHFPGHRHYYLAGDGSFETYVPVAEKGAWEEFMQSELTNSNPSGQSHGTK